MSIIYTPYTYLIGWSKLNTWYYGVRYARKHCVIYSSGCHPDDLWKTYFTSSELVKSFRKINGEPDIIQIRKTFETATAACNWESKFLIRMNAVNRINFLNQDSTQSPHKVFQVLHKNTCFIYNESTDKCFRWKNADTIPIGFIKGIRPWSNKRKEQNKNRRWFYNETTCECVMTVSKPIGEDWIQGKRPNSHSNSKSLTGKYIWITNGVEHKNILTNEQIPYGWRKGQLSKIIPKEKIRRNFINITNEIEVKHIDKNAIIPDGWRKGILKFIYITDDVIKKKILINQNIPDGWHKIIKNKYQHKEKIKKFFITDGVNSIKILVGSEIPDGWHTGRTVEKKIKKEKIWITNKLENKFIYKDSTIPEGFSIGKTKQKRKIINANSLNTIWINNEVVNKRINVNDIIPDGYTVGRLHYDSSTVKSKNKKIYTNIITGEEKYFIMLPSIEWSRGSKSRVRSKSCKGENNGAYGRKFYRNDLTEEIVYTNDSNLIKYLLSSGWINKMKPRGKQYTIKTKEMESYNAIWRANSSA